jgi:hypothetical protein
MIVISYFRAKLLDIYYLLCFSDASIFLQAFGFVNLYVCNALGFAPILETIC